MNSINKYIEKLTNFLISLVLLFVFTSCNQLQIERDDRTLGERKKDIRVEDRGLDVEGKLAEEGGGISKLFGIETSIGFEGSVVYQVALDKVSFMPLNSVDSASGIIITDWFADENSSVDESLKLTVKFLSNEIRADGINVIIHKKTCEEKNKCIIKKIDSTLAGEIKLAILREAAILSQQDIEKNKVPYSMPGVFKSER